MKTREEALKAFREMTLGEQIAFHLKSSYNHWHFSAFKASTQAIERAFNEVAK